jgi:molecular chaperone HtpG
MLNSSLEEVLKGKPVGEHLFHNLKRIEEKAELLLSMIVETFPEYTIHDIRHSKEVIKNLNLVIPDTLKANLNDYEIYFLIASAYLHDIGMVNFPEFIKEVDFKEFSENEKRGNPEVTDEEIIRKYIREKHHLRSEEFIVKHFEDLSIEDEHQASIIGRICRGHRKENLHDRNLFKPDRGYKNFPINIPLMAAFLRVADELDLTFERTPAIIYELIPPKEPISKEEWEKHLSVAGVVLSSEDPSLIKASATCKNPKIHRALKRLETRITNELEDLPYHLYQYRDFRRDLPRKVIMDIESIGYKPYDFKFTLREREIADLLMGERLYKRKEECLRELLKNSVDACRMRRDLLNKRGLECKPEIVFELTSSNDKIIVTDNGMGMDEDIIERYFTKIGESFYRSQEFLEKEPSFTPVSELGIGILSCFMMADKITVETKTDDSGPLLIEIDDISEYFFVRKGEKAGTGTKVTLFLKESIDKEKIYLNYLEEEIRHYARHLDFPVKVILPHNVESIITDYGFKPKIEYFEPVQGFFGSDELPPLVYLKYDLHSIKIDDEIEGGVAVLLEKDEKVGLKPILKMIGPKWISTGGIFVGNISDIIPKWFKSAYLFVDLNLKRNVLDLNAARNDIVRNDKFKKFVHRLEKMLIAGLEDFLNMTEQKARKDNVDPVSFINRFFDNYLIYSEISQMKKKNELSDEFLDLIRGFYCFKCFSKGEIKYLRQDAILKDGRPIILLYDLKDYDEAHIKQILSGCSGFAQNELYLLREYPGYLFAECLFEDIDSYSFTFFVNVEKSNELKEIIPKAWKLVRFKNYKTDRLIEFSHYDFTIVNRDNRFINLLIKDRPNITGDRKIAVEGFFKSLKMDIRYNFENVIKKQKEILKWFVEDGLISEDEIDNYILTKEDFPPHIFKSKS